MSAEASGNELNLDDPSPDKVSSPKRSRHGGAQYGGVDEETMEKLEKARQETEENLKSMKEMIEKLQEHTNRDLEELRKNMDDTKYELSTVKTEMEQSVKKMML